MKQFDIHLASDRMTPKLETELSQLGFKKDDFIGGTTGVVHPCHYSNHPGSIPEAERIWMQSVELLERSTPNAFFGYGEWEVTPPQFNRAIEWKPFRPEIPFPIARLPYEVCPIGEYKDFDVHISAKLRTLDAELQARLEDESGFHYVDIRKSPERVVRVYTFQPLGVGNQGDIFERLYAYFREAGGMEGKIKLEVTRAYQRFPADAPVCPIVRNVPLAKCIDM